MTTDSNRVRRGRANYLIETPTVRVWAVAPGRLALYARQNENAWIAAEHPVDLTDYR